MALGVAADGTVQTCESYLEACHRESRYKKGCPAPTTCSSRNDEIDQTSNANIKNCCIVRFSTSVRVMPYFLCSLMQKRSHTSFRRAGPKEQTLNSLALTSPALNASSHGVSDFAFTLNTSPPTRAAKLPNHVRLSSILIPLAMSCLKSQSDRFVQNDPKCGPDCSRQKTQQEVSFSASI